MLCGIAPSVGGFGAAVRRGRQSGITVSVNTVSGNHTCPRDARAMRPGASDSVLVFTQTPTNAMRRDRPLPRRACPIRPDPAHDGFVDNVRPHPRLIRPRAGAQRRST